MIFAFAVYAFVPPFYLIVSDENFVIYAQPTFVFHILFSIISYMIYLFYYLLSHQCIALDLVLKKRECKIAKIDFKFYP